MRSRETLIIAIRQDLCRVARAHGAPKGVGPSITSYQEEGRWGVIKVRAVVGGYDYPDDGNATPRLSWSEALERYGLEAWSSAIEATEGDLVEDLRRVGRLAGRGPGEMPTVDEYREHGRWSYMTLYRRLGETWWAIAERAKLERRGRARRGSVTPDRIIEDYRHVAEVMGCAPGEVGPTRREFDQHVPYAGACARYHFGSWTEMVTRAGFQVHANPIEAHAGREGARA